MALHEPILPAGAWQQGSMLNVCDIYRQSQIIDARGKPLFSGWMAIVAGQPYQHVATRNFSEPSDIGRIIQPSSISTEFGYFPAGVDLKDQDVLRDVTPGGGLNGQVYRCLGAPTVYDGIPVPQAAYMNVELRQEPKPPADLPF